MMMQHGPMVNPRPILLSMLCVPPTCHDTDLRPIHGEDCFACHTTDYYASVEGNWQGGCQQGACHQSYHDDSPKRVPSSELFPAEYLYEDGELHIRLKTLLSDPVKISRFQVP